MRHLRIATDWHANYRITLFIASRVFHVVPGFVFSLPHTGHNAFCISFLSAMPAIAMLSDTLMSCSYITGYPVLDFAIYTNLQIFATTIAKI